MYASLANQTSVVDMLIKRNAAVTLQDINGQTALHLAAANVSITLGLISMCRRF